MEISFTDQELRFLKEEFGISGKMAGELSDDELLELADECFDIELEGELRDGSTMPDRCGTASSIVTKINAVFG